MTRRRERELLALLLVNPGHAVTDDSILDALWCDVSPERALPALRTTASRLRRALAAPSRRTDLLTRASGGYRLDPQGDSVDSSRFVSLVAEATRIGDPRSRAAVLQEALGLWRGPPLVEFADLDFARTFRIRLEELRLDAIEALLVARHENGETRSLVAELEQLVTENPLREGLWRVLILALDGAGRSSESTRALERAYSALSSIGLEPGPQLRETERSIRRSSDPADAPDADDPQPDELPTPTTSFVGRRAQLAELTALLRTNRLITLTGPAGVGKSRLAIEVARRAHPTFGGGACLVDLHDIEDLDTAQTVISEAVRTGPATASGDLDDLRLVTALRSKELLLLLDGCDRLPLRDLVLRLVSSCPNLAVLSTSRQRLGASGEVVRPIAPLRLPTDLDGGEPAEAVELFVDRARSVSPSFELSPENTALVTDMVRRLDGLPLAIEVAAAWSGLLPLGEMSRRLTTLLRVGSDARGSRLESTFASCYGELAPDEQAVFDAVSILGASWTLATAEAVCDPGDIASSLGVLVDRSLLVLEPGHDGATSRYSMLRLIRKVGRSHLRASGRLAEMRSRHARHFATELRTRFGELWHPRPPEAAEWFHRSIDDVDSAHRWLVGRDPEEAGAMVTVASWFWIEFGYPSVAGPSRLEEAAPGGGTGLAAARSTLIWASAEILRLPCLGRRFGLPLGANHDRPGRGLTPVPPPGRHRELAIRALDLCYETGHQNGIASAQLAVAAALGFDGLYPEATDRALDARSRAVAREDPWILAVADLVLANLALGSTDQPAAVDGAARARLALRDQPFDHQFAPLLRAWLLDTEARIAFIDGRPDEAMASWAAALDIDADRRPRHPRRAQTLVLMAMASMAGGKYDSASGHLAEAEQEALQLGLTATLVQVHSVQGVLRANLGDTATARSLLEAALVGAGQGGTTSHVAKAWLATVAVLERDYDAATGHALQYLRAPEAALDHAAVTAALESLSACAVAEGRHRRAAILSGATEPLHAMSFLPRSQLSRRLAELVEGRLAHDSGAADVHNARRLGAELELRSVIDYAVSGRDALPTHEGIDGATAA